MSISNILNLVQTLLSKRRRGSVEADITNSGRFERGPKNDRQAPLIFQR